MSTAVSFSQIPEGDAGTIATLERMRELVYQAIGDDEFVSWARLIGAGAVDVHHLRIGRAVASAQAIADWCRHTFVYQTDPRDVEGRSVEDYLVDPRVQALRWSQTRAVWGDCDDASMLVAAIGMVSGLRAKFRAIGQRGSDGPFSHVYPLLLIGQFQRRECWVTLDLTVPPTVPPPAPDRAVEVLL